MVDAGPGRGVVEEDEVPGAGLGQRRDGAAARRLLRGGPRQVDAQVAEDQLGEPRAVQALGRVGATPEVGDAEVLLRLGDHGTLRRGRAGAGGGGTSAGPGQTGGRRGAGPVPRRGGSGVHEAGLDLGDPSLDLRHSVHGTSPGAVAAPGPAGHEVVDRPLLGCILGMLDRLLVSIAETFQALGALGGGGPLRAHEFGLLGRGRGQGPGVRGIGGRGAQQRHGGEELPGGQRPGEDGGRERRLVVGGATVGVSGRARRLRRGRSGGTLLRAAQLEHRLQPERGPLHADLTIR